MSAETRSAREFLRAANAASAAGRRDVENEVLQEAVHAHPKCPELWNNYGILLHWSGRCNSALKCLDNAISLRRSFAAAYANRAQVLLALGRVKEALRDIRESISLSERNASGHRIEGEIHLILGDLDAALDCARRACEIDAQDVDALVLHAKIKAEKGLYALSHREHSSIIERFPSSAYAYNSRGILLCGLLRPSEALEDFAVAVQLNARYVEARFNQALCRLMLQDYDQGWRGYEYRTREVRKGSGREWDGTESVNGEIIVVYDEQGFGDNIQFFRLLPMLKARGANVILEVRAPLVRIFQHSFPSIQVIDRGGKLGGAKFNVSLLSLPYLLQYDPRLRESKGTSYLSIPEEEILRWRGKIVRSHSLLVGFASAGALTNKNDGRRTVPGDALRPLFQKKIDYVCLQREVRARDKESYKDRENVFVPDLDIQDFLDTGALIECVDLVITVDTAVAHLAGALGKRTWLLLPYFHADWRWTTEPEACVWYPSVRYFRESSHGGWGGVIARVSAELDQLQIHR